MFSAGIVAALRVSFDDFVKGCSEFQNLCKGMVSGGREKEDGRSKLDVSWPLSYTYFLSFPCADSEALSTFLTADSTY